MVGSSFEGNSDVGQSGWNLEDNPVPVVQHKMILGSSPQETGKVQLLRTEARSS
jgi:hypothetical protein